MKTFCHGLPHYLRALLVSVGSVVMLSLIRVCALNAHQAVTPTRQLRTCVRRARQAIMGLRQVRHCPRHATRVNLASIRPMQACLSVSHVLPAAPAPDTKLPIIYLVQWADTTVLLVRPSVWFVPMENMARIMDPPYVWIVR